MTPSGLAFFEVPMPTAYESLNTELTLRAAARYAQDADVAAYQECLISIAQYVAALTAQATATATDVVSYSVAGRSVTRSRGTEYSATIQRLKRSIYTYLYGDSALVDFRRAGANSTIDDATFEG